MSAASPARRALAWAPFLACSWTWCVGMFFPILMVRDFGALGYAVFAIPNIIGAAGVAWAVRSRADSLRWIEAHGRVMRLFGWVTIAFHGYWIGWMTRWLPIEGAPTIIAWCAAGVGLASLLALRFSWRALAWPTWLFSAGVLGWMALSGRIEAPPAPALAPADGRLDILWLAPVVAFGFLLCPVLDLTLHRARRASDGVAPETFGLGFGVFFATTIVLTLAAAGWLLRARASGADSPAGPVEVLFIAHLVAQLAYTVGAHARDLASGPAEVRRGAPVAGVLFALAAALGLGIGAIGPVAATTSAHAPALEAGEIGYRVFLSAYGFVFPAYVWLCVIPRGRRGVRVPSRRALVVWLGAVALAAPMFTLGYVFQITPWLAGGLGLVLCARLLIPPGDPEPRQHTSGG